MYVCAIEWIEVLLLSLYMYIEKCIAREGVSVRERRHTAKRNMNNSGALVTT